MAEETVNFFLHSSDDVLSDFERDFEQYSNQYQEIPYVDDYVIEEKLKGMEHLASVVKLVEHVSKLAWRKSELEKKCDCLKSYQMRNNILSSSPYSQEEDHDQNSIWNKGLQKMRAKSTKVKASFNRGKEEKVQKLHQRSQSTGSIDINDILQRSDSDSRRKRREIKFSKRRLSKWARKVRAGLAPERALSHVVSAKEMVVSNTRSKALKAEITKSRSHSDFNNLENSMSSPEPSPTITVYGEGGRLIRRRSSPSLFVEEDSSPLSRSGSLKSAVTAFKRVKGALTRTGSFKGDEYSHDSEGKKRTIDHIVLLSPPARRSTYNSNEPVRKQATARTRPTRTSLAAFPSDERGGIQNYLTADIAKRIGEWDNRRNSAQQSSLKHEDSFSQDFIKKMHEWEKKKAFVEKEKSPKTLAPPVDTISNHSNTSEERYPLNLGEDFSKKVAEWERIKEQTYLNPAAENERSRSKERQKYQKMVSKDMQKIEKTQLKIEKEKAKLEKLKATISVNEEVLSHGLSQEFAKKYHDWQKQHVETDSRSISPIPQRRTKLEHAQESVEVEEIAMSIASPDKTLIRSVSSPPKQMTVADSSKPEQYFASSTFDNEANNLLNVLKTDIERVGKKLISFDKKENKKDLRALESCLEDLSRLLERFDSAPKISHATTADILKMATKISQEREMSIASSVALLQEDNLENRFLDKCSSLIEKSILFTNQLSSTINASLETSKASKQTQTSSENGKKNILSASLIEEIVPQFSIERRASRPKLERIPAVEYHSPQLVRKSAISSNLQIFEPVKPIIKECSDKTESSKSQSTTSVDSPSAEGAERLDIIEALVAERSKQLRDMIKKFDFKTQSPHVTSLEIPGTPDSERKQNTRFRAFTYEADKEPFLSYHNEPICKSLPSSPNKTDTTSSPAKTFKFPALKTVKLKLFKKNIPEEKMYVSALCRNAMTVDVSGTSSPKESPVLSKKKTNKNWLKSRFFPKN